MVMRCGCKIVVLRGAASIQFCALHESAQDLLYHLVISHKEHRGSETCKTCLLIEHAGRK